MEKNYHRIIDSDQYQKILSIVNDIEKHGYWVGSFIDGIIDELIEMNLNLKAINQIEVIIPNMNSVIMDIYFISNKEFHETHGNKSES